jgi:hypothetical protein
VGAEREFLGRLEKNAVVRWDDYQLPNLQVVMAGRFDFDKVELLTRLRKLLNQTRADVRGRELTRQSFPLPSIAITKDQLQGIKECTQKKCKVKLLDGEEKIRMEKSQDKVGTFHDILLERIKRYVATAELTGYEDRPKNNPVIAQMLSVTKFFPELYPRVQNFLTGHLGNQKGSIVKSSFFRNEIVIIAPDRMQPILRIGEVMEFEEGGTPLFVELHVYTNHYFDFSMRVYEVLPHKSDPKKSVLVLTDIMEIDELKKSSIIRALYTGKMVEAVNEYQEKELESLR